jgi:hypothetical protein
MIIKKNYEDEIKKKKDGIKKKKRNWKKERKGDELKSREGQVSQVFQVFQLVEEGNSPLH